MSGRRNKPARARLLGQMKENFSLTSVPRSEDQAEQAAASRRLRLDNHFLWTVVQRSQVGDGTFPHLYEYYEKPDLHGRDFDKVTYVLYMDKGTVVDRKTSLKETQTVVSGIFVPEEPLNTTEPYYGEPPVRTDITPQQYYYEQPPGIRRVPTPERRRRKKLIYDFYYVKKDRSRSRSPGDKNYNYNYYDLQKQPQTTKSHVSFPEQDPTELEAKSFTSAVEKNRNRPDRWQLRAGADTVGKGYNNLNKNNEEISSVVKKNSSKVMAYVKCGLVTHGVTEELLKTSSGTNQYLYVAVWVSSLYIKSSRLSKEEALSLLLMAAKQQAEPNS